MTSSIIIASPARRGDRLYAADLAVAGSPHPHRAVYAVPFETVLALLSLMLRAGRRGGNGQHRRAAAGTRVTAATRRTRRFLKDWWVLLIVGGGFAVVTIVGVLVLSLQVPR
jgi:hypothetical protein